MKKIIILIILITCTLLMSAPSFAVDDINGPEVVYKEFDEATAISDIISLYSAPNAMIYASADEFTSNGHLIGNRHITLAATDGLSEKEKDITISIVRNKLPKDTQGNNIIRLLGIHSDASIILQVYSNQTVTYDLVLQTLINLELISVVNPVQRQKIADDYTENKTESGTYAFSFRIIDASGTMQTITSDVQVLEVDESWDNVDVNPRNNFFGNIGTIIGNIFLVIIGIIIIVAVIITGYFIYKRVANYMNKR